MELRSYASTSDDCGTKPLLDCPLCETPSGMRDASGDSPPFAGAAERGWQPCRLLSANGRRKSVACLVSNGYPHIICSSHTAASKTTVEQVLPAFQKVQVPHKCHSLPRNFKFRPYKPKVTPVAHVTPALSRQSSEVVGPSDFKSRLDVRPCFCACQIFFVKDPFLTCFTVTLF